MLYMRFGRARDAVGERHYASGPATAVKPRTRMDIVPLCVNCATAQAGTMIGPAPGGSGTGCGRPDSAEETPAATTAWQ